MCGNIVLTENDCRKFITTGLHQGSCLGKSENQETTITNLKWNEGCNDTRVCRL